MLDSGFCVLKAIIEHRRKGVFACALIKKRQSWPIGVPGDVMQRRFDRPEVRVGDVDAISGKQDDVPYYLWGMKEPGDYVVRMMAMGGPLGSRLTMSAEKRREGQGRGLGCILELRKFKYTCPYEWHFSYLHVVDDHDNLRHATPAVEESWVTQRWECRVFSFILAISEINSFLALRYFEYGNNTIEGCPLLIVFCHLSTTLGRAGRRRRLLIEALRPRFTSSSEPPKHAWKWSDGAWICDANYNYQSYFCSMKCGECTRLYCVCDPGSRLCKDCIVAHASNSLVMSMGRGFCPRSFHLDFHYIYAEPQHKLIYLE